MTRWRRMALGVCLLILAACGRQGGGEEGRLEQTPLEGRALSGSVLPQDAASELIAPQPVLAAAGEIVLGARVDEELAQAARDLNLGSDAVRALRANGAAGVTMLPADVVPRVRRQAERRALAAASRDAALTLERLGLQGAVEARGGGLIVVRLAHAVIPASEAGSPRTIAWNEADGCPHLVTQDELERDAALATRCVIKALRGVDRFAFVGPNYIAVASAAPAPDRGVAIADLSASAPNDPLLALQWNFRPRGTGAEFSRGGAGFTAFWAAGGIGSRQVRVAVIDTGLDLHHPDLQAANIGRGVDVVSDPWRANDGDGVDSDPQDAGDACDAGNAASYHGTHIAGIIGASATNNGAGVAGGAWNVTVLPVRALGRCGGALADIVAGVAWAAGTSTVTAQTGAELANPAPADIINLSFSFEAPCPAALQRAIDAANEAGALVVVAAGDRADQAAHYAPANCQHVIVVGASDARGDLAFYSNFGPELDLVAPGGDMFADADGDGRPDGILSTRATQTGCYDPVNQSTTARCNYSFQQGASMSAAHVSAALALLAAQTGLRGPRLREALLQRAVSPFPAGFGRIECARVRNGVAGADGACERPAGKGYLDLARAARRASH
ncbi:MAG: S8 family serine peptidase [Pseudomonadota bacterium]